MSLLSPTSETYEDEALPGELLAADSRRSDIFLTVLANSTVSSRAEFIVDADGPIHTKASGTRSTCLADPPVYPTPFDRRQLMEVLCSSTRAGPIVLSREEALKTLLPLLDHAEITAFLTYIRRTVRNMFYDS